MRRAILALCLVALPGAFAPAAAADCPGHPGALGTSRTIVVDPTEHPLLGVHNYRESLPLNDREVVLTFDDGPLPPHTSRILDILASECVKATFFMVGRMARGYPNMVKRVYAEGHTIANHSESHPFTFHKMSVDAASREIETGFESIRAALGDPKGVSNFFRVPGLLRQDSVERYLTSRGYQTWSVDLMADDWTHINHNEIVRRAINRLEARGKGILLLHDIQPATASGLADLLRELKVRGFKVVHVIQADAEHVKTASLPEQWIARSAQPSYWPSVQVASLVMPQPVLEAPNPRNFGIADPSGTYPQSVPDRLRGGDREVPLSPIVLLPRGIKLVALYPPQTLPAPAADNFRYTRVWVPRSSVRAVRKPISKKPVTATSAVSPKTPALPPAARSNQPPRPPKPMGHQIQLPPKPTAGAASQRVGMN
jgi:peptidoglycan-N-acetylglucosamine deacetylase